MKHLNSSLVFALLRKALAVLTLAAIVCVPVPVLGDANISEKPAAGHFPLVSNQRVADITARIGQPNAT